MTELNVGNIDRAIRLLFGIALAVLAATGVVGWWGYLGLAVAATGLVAFCPLYSLLGLRTTWR